MAAEIAPLVGADAEKAKRAAQESREDEGRQRRPVDREEDEDDEEDGDWVAPTVPNPKCADVSGCGPWTKPMMKNPDYKGKWTAPFIDNPAYNTDRGPVNTFAGRFHWQF